MSKPLILLTLIGILSGLLLTPLSGQAQDEDPHVVRFQIEHEGNSFGVRLYVPSAYATRTAPLPLVVMLHGAAGDADSTAWMTGFDAYGERDGVLVAYPTSLTGYWDYGVGLYEWQTIDNVIDDLGFLEKTYAWLLENYDVDPNRVFMAGFSNGARMVMRLACEHSTWFAGVAIVASGMSSEVADNCPTEAQMAVYYQHGTDDQTVPWLGKPLRYGLTIISYAYAAPDTITFWVLRNGCENIPEITDIPDLNPDDFITVRRARFSNCESGKPVEFYVGLNDDHSWMGAPSRIPTDYVSSGDTSAWIWEFFSGLPTTQD